MKKQRIIILILIFFSTSIIFAQPNSPSNSAMYKELNNYVEYSNEIVHALQVMYDDFEYLNIAFNDFVEQKRNSIEFEARRLFSNYDYFPVLPQDLYQQIFNNNSAIPFDSRGRPLKLVGEIYKVVHELEAIRQKLDIYIQSGNYLRDIKLAEGYDYLQRIEVLYYDVYSLQEKLHWNLNTIAQTYEGKTTNPYYAKVIIQLQKVIDQSKRLLRAVHAKDRSAGLLVECDKMKDILYDLRRKRVEILWGIPSDEQAIHKNYALVLDRAEKLNNHTIEYLNISSKRYQNRSHAPYFYFYNYDLLDNYNRYGNGLASTFNKIVKYTTESYLYIDELPPIFETIYPDHPSFDSLRNDDNPNPEWFLARLAQMRKDSLRQVDSLAKLPKVDTLKVGEPTLDGFATNNLIFLIDVSSSMQEKSKLPLLKTSLEQFLELMRKEDNITVIAYSEKAEILLSPTSAALKAEIMDILNNLKVQSTSNVDKGLSMAYLVAQESFIKEGNNRIILATDGNFSIKKKTQRLIRKRAKQNIRLSAFYFSEKEFKTVATALQKITLLGKGEYHHITEITAEKALLMEAQSVQRLP